MMQPIQYTAMEDLRYCLTEIENENSTKNKLIHEHFKNISSNPASSYSTKEQLSLLSEIMNCYNKNMLEYQKNMNELSIITKNIIQSEIKYREDVLNTLTIEPELSLYEYFMNILFGVNYDKSNYEKNKNIIATQVGNEPTMTLENIFVDKEPENIETTNPVQASINTNNNNNNNRQNEITIKNSSKDIKKRRNTIQPVIKHLTHI